MTRTVLILGARGRFGQAAAEAFAAEGWRLRRLARSWSAAEGGPGPERIAADAFDAAALARAAEGVDAIVNALNPPYPDWAAALPRLTAAVIAAGRASGARLYVPGNVYTYGAGMPARLTEATPVAPSSRKGRLRVEMEAAYAASGCRVLVLRGGDFIGLGRSGNWFDAQIAARVEAGRVVYPGPLDRAHAWAYLPDMARAMAALAAREADLPAQLSLGFPGYTLTGAELIAALERVTGRSLRRRGVPWLLLRALAPVQPMMRELLEMRYLWDVPHGIDGAGLAAWLPGFRATDLDTALAAALASYRAPGA